MNLPLRILRNTGWNMLGTAAPIIAALFAVPLVLRTLGATEFGILAMGWVIMGYFAMFDLGLGRATTKFIAELRGKPELSRQLAEVAWTSIHAHNLLGALSCLLFVAVTPWLVITVFSIPPELQPTAFTSFYWMAASLPFIIVSSCLRGILEAFNRFDATNKVRAISSLVNYAAPIVVLPFAYDLVLIIAIICISRALVLAALAIYCLREVPELHNPRGVSLATTRQLFFFGGWVTVSSLITPVIMVTDRIFIAGIFDIASVSYYVVPYEIIIKLWILSASLMGAMFPVMSAMASRDTAGLWQLAIRAERYLIAASLPVIAFLLTFSRELLLVWVGSDFAEQSSAVAKWLALGMLFSIAAQAPITMVQTTNRPDLIAKLQLVQLPLFVGLAWYMVQQFGSVGAAMAWAGRACLEALLAHAIAHHITAAPEPKAGLLTHALLITLFIAAFWAIDSLWRKEIILKLLLSLPLLLLFVLWIWRALLIHEERRHVHSWLRLILASNR